MTSEPGSGELPEWAEAAITRGFALDAVDGLPIYLQLQHVIARLVRDRALPVNSQLPPDHRLAALLGISLGTVQKALGNLAAQGCIRREHGRGTFVAAPRQALTGAWHFRFHDPDSDEPLPVYSLLLGRRVAGASPALARALGEDPAGYVEIERLFDIGGRFLCHARLRLGATRFSRLLDYPRERLENVNLKDVFAEDFLAPTLAVRERIRATRLDPEIAGHLGESAGVAAMRLDVLACGAGDAPLSFQEIHIPVTTCALDITPLRASG